jgi:hypothetical protein
VPGAAAQTDEVETMRLKRRIGTWGAAAVLAGALGGASQTWAQEPASEGTTVEPASGVQALRAELEALRTELERLKAAGSAGLEARMLELERRLDVLAQELEKTRMGEAGTASAEAEDGRLRGEYGLGPAASTVYRQQRGASIAGYGEMTYQNYSEEREDDAPSGRIDELDFLRAIVYVGYKFTDRIVFNSEIEFEHATTGRGGSVSVEFAHVDFLVSEAVGIRLGMVLVPMGFLNELHEPPIFHGVLRPDVERNLIPSTWRENGAGVFGEVGPVSYRLYTVAGLDANGYTAGGIRGGRQSGGFSRAEDFALTGRLDYTGVQGLLIGGAFYTGNSGQGRTLDGGEELEARTTLWDLHGQFEYRGLQLRGLWAQVDVNDVEQINELKDLSGSSSVGSRLSGGYVQAAYDLATLFPVGRWSIAPFVRYEVLNTQDEVPAGYAANPANEQTILTLGLSAKPIPQVILKVDYQDRSNEADTGVDQINLGVGYLF